MSPSPGPALRRERFRRALRRTLAAVLLVATCAAVAAEPPTAPRAAQLRLLYSESLFSTVNRNDALAAIKAWATAFGRRRAFALQVESGFYADVTEVRSRIRERSVELITCTSLEYLQLVATEPIEAVFLPGWKQATDDYVVLTRRDRNFHTLADLRGRSVALYRVGTGLGRLWLDATLADSGLGSVSEFFASTTETVKVSATILPVFFGKTDVAVAKRHGWETMKEMNPQLAAQMQVLTHSPVLPDAVICVLRHPHDHPYRQDLVRATAEMSVNPEGQQILMLFKTDVMVPFKPEHLDGVRALTAPRNRPVTAPERAGPAPFNGQATSP